MTGQQLERVSDPALQTLREQFAPEATATELAYFRAMAAHLELDPWAGHIVLIPFQGTHRPTTTVAGRRFIAERTGRLRDVDGPHWCGPRQFDRDGKRLPLEWLELWDQDDPPYAARCLVYVAGRELAVNGTVKWSEFAQHDRDGKLTKMWRRMPSHMLGKTAESLALRRAFPEVAAAVAMTGGPEDDDIAAEVAASAPAIDAESERDTSQDTEGDAISATDGGPPAIGGVSRSDSDVVARAEALGSEALNAVGLYAASMKFPWPPETDRDRRRVGVFLDAWERDR